MSAPHSFELAQALTLREIAALTGAEPRPGADLDHRVTGIAPLDRATPSDVTFLDHARYADQAATTAAGICLTLDRLASALPDRVIVLCVRAPYAAFVEVARTLFPGALRPSSLFETTGKSPHAFVHPSARMENGVTIDPGAVVGPGVEIGAGTVIGPGAVLGPGVRIGRHCAIGATASITHALIGDRVIVHPGCAIGQDGFGFTRGAKGARKVPQVGRVIIQDDVEIGANTTIDRGAIRDTVIGEGTKIDNLVQIAHNVTIGRHCLLAGQVGISGSTTVEDGVIMGGQAGIADHLTVGAGAMLAAKTGLMTGVPAGERWAGAPGRPIRQWLREVATLERLARQGKAKPGENEAGE
ncbi:MAG: UDP-3-O-[3-hydroxymyristoyl] glucosamine N-acyltransferase [Alphaproteobacteria bacterium]|jgi:UDP-3-O-[3-hydroxymyristoyl] glucosamine N-acyltransferase|nr:UDP-3-O-[3-hydroxymyristoyl] glucosamine N-acyltransferase [Alphaproteobacteria bacterium]